MSLAKFYLYSFTQVILSVDRNLKRWLSVKAGMANWGTDLGEYGK